MAPAKAGHPKPSTGNDPHPRRSSRANKGEGGAAEQLAKVGTQIEPVKKRKKTAQDSIPSDEAQNPMAPTQVPKKRRKTVKTVANNVQVLQPTSRIQTSAAVVAPPALQLRLSPLPFVTPVPAPVIVAPAPASVNTAPAPAPVNNLHHDTQQAAPNPDPNDSDCDNHSLSSGSEDGDGSSTIEEYQSSADDEANREDYEISDDEDERNAIAVIRGILPVVPPAYEQVVNDLNIDPTTLQSQPAPVPSKKTRKRKSKSGGHVNPSVEGRGSERIQTSMDQSTDIVEGHHSRNPQPRMPDPAALTRSREGLEQHLRELDERRNTGRIPPVTVHLPNDSSTPQGPVPTATVSVRAQHLHRRAPRNMLNPPTEDNATPVML